VVASTQERRLALVVHGGAGHVQDGTLEARLEGCRPAARAGWQVLSQGGSALDAVQAAVEVLENDPLFNAGRGSVLNAAGAIQMDASLMEGEQLRAGAVATISRIPNPIRLARQVLEFGRHVLLVGKGAERFAADQGLPLCTEEALIASHQQRRWKSWHGTVGCVAVDRRGVPAAATSTGGLFGALPGRVGDSALIGCGTYATRVGAASCTGIGEAIIRVGLARAAVDLIQAGRTPAEAAEEAMRHFAAATGSEAGLIVVDASGRTGAARNTRRMPACILTQQGEELLA
jgi:beta-aspartyl-peptidase (threonine type)